jgi:hypothetical protein
MFVCSISQAKIWGQQFGMQKRDDKWKGTVNKTNIN